MSGYVLELVAVVGGMKFLSLALGYGHTCGLTDERKLYCWGTNPFGQLGTGILLG